MRVPPHPDDQPEIHLSPRGPSDPRSKYEVGGPLPMRGRNSVQQGHAPLSLALERLVDERARDTVQEEGLVPGSRADRI